MANHEKVRVFAAAGRAGPASTRLVERSFAVAAKVRIRLGLARDTLPLIDSAAVALGTTRSRFMVACARQRAIDVQLDHCLLRLNADSFDSLSDILDQPQAPGPRLCALRQRVPAWHKQAMH